MKCSGTVAGAGGGAGVGTGEEVDMIIFFILYIYLGMVWYGYALISVQWWSYILKVIPHKKVFKINSL